MVLALSNEMLFSVSSLSLSSRRRLLRDLTALGDGLSISASFLSGVFCNAASTLRGVLVFLGVLPSTKILNKT